MQIHLVKKLSCFPIIRQFLIFFNTLCHFYNKRQFFKYFLNYLLNLCQQEKPNKIKEQSLARSIVFFLFSLFALSANAQYYSTLPKGVRLILNRNIQSDVKSSYNRTQSETPYAYKIEANVETLSKIDNKEVQEALELFKPYPEAYEKLSLGTHTLDAKAEVNVNVYGFGYGITDRMTAYIGMPIYDAKVRIKYGRPSDSSNKEVAEVLQKQYGDDWAQTLGNITEALVNVDEHMLQSALVNTLGYDELGTWEGQGLGDTEFGLMYNFVKKEKWGLMATFGGVAPTGYVDDPDLIQDIGFGDGQWDAFAEFGGGYTLSPTFGINAWARYTHQFASEKTLRTPFSRSIPLGDTKAKFREKLGNNWLLSFSSDIFLNDWLKFQPEYIYSYTEKAKYDSDNKLANALLAEGSDSYFHNFKLSMQLSSVNLFLKQKFMLPAQLNISHQTMLEGRNTPKVDLTEIEVRMFF